VTDSTHQDDRLAAVLAPVLDSVGVTLYDVELTGSGRARTLRVLIDRDGGVDLAAVTAATEALGPVLDTEPAVAAVLPGTYLLEVSSPGLERPLRTPAHFRAAVGTPISLKATTADGTRRRDRVLLVGADDDGIEVELDGAHEHVGYGDIVQARTVFEWGPAPKPGKSTGKPGQGRPRAKGTTPKPKATATHLTRDATR
jgi:ribosome maturation factor RimP